MSRPKPTFVRGQRVLVLWPSVHHAPTYRRATVMYLEWWRKMWPWGRRGWVYYVTVDGMQEMTCPYTEKDMLELTSTTAASAATK